jgi:hypothetical protein
MKYRERIENRREEKRRDDNNSNNNLDKNKIT